MEIVVADPSPLPEGAARGTGRPPLEWWLTYQEAGAHLMRSKKTIMNLVYEYRLERRTFFDGHGPYRKRVTLLPPATVHRLAELTGRAFLIPRQ